MYRLMHQLRRQTFDVAENIFAAVRRGRRTDALDMRREQQQRQRPDRQPRRTHHKSDPPRADPSRITFVDSRISTRNILSRLSS